MGSGGGGGEMGSDEKMPVAFQQEIIKLRRGLIEPLVDRSDGGHNRGIITEKHRLSGVWGQNCGAGEETLTLDLFLGKEAL